MEVEATAILQITPAGAKSVSRPVCNPQEHSTQEFPVSVSRSKSSRSGRTVNVLEFPRNSVRVSTFNSDTQSVRKAQEGKMPSPTRSSKMAKKSLVHRPPASVHNKRSQTTDTTGSAQSRPVCTPESRVVSVSRLDALQRGYEKRGYTHTASKFLATALRTSTSKVYDAKWRSYTTWCIERSRDPFNPDGPQLADYFCFLFSDLGLRTDTMRGHKASILQVLRSYGELPLDIEADLRKLFFAFTNKQVKIVKDIPKWDLGLVLKVLMGAPFEPMVSCSFEHLTYKTVFLVSLATGARRGELLALRRGSFVQHTEDWSKIFLTPDPDFVPKARRATMNMKAIEIGAFSKVVTKKEIDYLLCPVRALRYYLDRTALDKFEQGRKKLFLPVKLDNHAELAANGLSAIFKNAVKACYDFIDPSLVDEFTITLHQSRLLAHSLAKAGNVSLEAILQSGHWKDPTTFSQYYLKSLLVYGENLRCLGPLAARRQHCTTFYYVLEIVLCVRK